MAQWERGRETMSAAQLQRVVVRMLFDSTFVDRIYQDAVSALGDTDVTEREARWLTQVDPRRWRADPLRAARSLHALLEEFPISVMAACPRGNAADLIAFFRSQQFHTAIMEDGSLAVTFAEWLSLQSTVCQPYVTLELAMARLRRRQRADLTLGRRDGHVQTASTVIAITLPTGTLKAYMDGLASIRQDADGVVHFLVNNSMSLPSLSDGFQEGVLVESTPDISLSEVSLELAHVLALLADGCSTADAIAALIDCGSSPLDAPDVLKSLLKDGLIMGPIDYETPSTFIPS